jgi:hypothetical protein
MRSHENHTAWYEEASLPRYRKLSVSENGWTNNALGLQWLNHFDQHTKAGQVGANRLLILDGHESHLNQDFKDYCLRNKILTLWMPSHSSHILQLSGLLPKLTRIGVKLVVSDMRAIGESEGY